MSLRPRWFNATRCLQRQRGNAARTTYTAPNSSLESTIESPEDWHLMQENRARFKMLLDLFNQYGSTQTRENAFQPHHTLSRPLGPSQTTLSALVATGAHFGHTASLMNPNFLPYTYGTRAGLTIIDLEQTLPLLRRAANLVRAVAQRNGTIIFVGTRPDLQDTIQRASERLGTQGYHIGERWLPGTLTNRNQLFQEESQEYRLTPDLVVFLNPLANMNAIRECAIQHVPTVGIIDSNADPRIVMYPIPANDDSPRTAQIIAGVLSVAGKEGVMAREENHKTQQHHAHRVLIKQALNGEGYV
ncbi:ribosomal protein S2, flavodoxin-like domain-containing protein [Pisolithus marmoratus]|nr:ribosomal protein S2, flavodoxin-like domain-containing protein [Pisolithus marmoratus]